MTHADEPAEEKNRLGLTDKMVRLSVGIENPEDIIWDIEQALAAVQEKNQGMSETRSFREQDINA